MVYVKLLGLLYFGCCRIIIRPLMERETEEMSRGRKKKSCVPLEEVMSHRKKSCVSLEEDKKKSRLDFFERDTWLSLSPSRHFFWHMSSPDVTPFTNGVKSCVSLEEVMSHKKKSCASLEEVMSHDWRHEWSHIRKSHVSLSRHLFVPPPPYTTIPNGVGYLITAGPAIRELLFHICDVTPFMCVTWLFLSLSRHFGSMICFLMCVMWLIHMCDTTSSLSLWTLRFGDTSHACNKKDFF